MSKTIGEVAESVLLSIGRATPGQDHDANYTKIVKDAYAGLYEMLKNDSLVNWAYTDNIPDWAVFPITVMLSGMVGDQFALDERIQQRFLSQFGTMRRLLASQGVHPYIHKNTEATYF